jgi:hypothetical protein
MPRGGFRIGAGRPTNRLVKADDCLRLDVLQLHRDGLLRCSGAVVWSWSGSREARVRAQVDPDLICLSYAVNGKAITDSIRLERTACTFGGSRPWLVCPSCGRLRTALLLHKTRFKCRQCHDLRYASQSEDVIERSWRAQAKLERNLGAHWQKPKYMHDATRERILARIFECEERRELAIANRYSGLI